MKVGDLGWFKDTQDAWKKGTTFFLSKAMDDGAFEITLMHNLQKMVMRTMQYF